MNKGMRVETKTKYGVKPVSSTLEVPGAIRTVKIRKSEGPEGGS